LLAQKSESGDHAAHRKHQWFCDAERFRDRVDQALSWVEDWRERANDIRRRLSRPGKPLAVSTQRSYRSEINGLEKQISQSAEGFAELLATAPVTWRAFRQAEQQRTWAARIEAKGDRTPPNQSGAVINLADRRRRRP